MPPNSTNILPKDFKNRILFTFFFIMDVNLGAFAANKRCAVPRFFIDKCHHLHKHDYI